MGIPGVLQGVLLGYSKGRACTRSRASPRAAAAALHQRAYLRVLTGYSRGTHRVFTGYLRDAQGMFEGFLRGTGGVLVRYSRGTLSTVGAVKVQTLVPLVVHVELKEKAR